MAVTLVYTKNGTPYIDQYNETAKKMATERDTYRNDQAKLRDAYRTQATTERDQNVATTNQNYDASGRKNYINYMQSQKALPSQLNALGIRGGASESSLIRLGNTYGTNVANNESARGTAIAGLNQAYEKALSDYDREYQTSLSDYDRDYNSRLASAYATAYQNQINYEREAQQKDLEYFSGVIEGLYKDTKSYDNLIASLRKSNDPNKEYKIMLAMKARNALDGSSSGGGGGGGGSYRSGGGGYGYSSGSDSSSSERSSLADPLSKVVSAAKKTAGIVSNKSAVNKVAKAAARSASSSYMKSKSSSSYTTKKSTKKSTKRSTLR